MSGYVASPADAAQELYDRATLLGLLLHDAERDTLKSMWHLARALSSGPYSADLLRRMGHPYAKRRPRPPDHPGIINFQSGRFLAAWRRRTGTWSGGALVSQLINDAPYAGYLDIEQYPAGTRHMIRRPISLLITMNSEAFRRRKIEEAVEGALNP